MLTNAELLYESPRTLLFSMRALRATHVSERTLGNNVTLTCDGFEDANERIVVSDDVVVLRETYVLSDAR